MKKIVLLIVIFMSATIVFAQNNLMTDELKYTINGHVKDSKTGEELIGATVYIKELKTGVITNVYGFYSLTLPPGKYTLSVSYIGYGSFQTKVDVTKNAKKNFELKPTDNELAEVKVTGEKANKNIVKVEMSTVKLQMKTIKKIPALMGEVDIIKSIQLLPGVTAPGEGSVGYYVRGGGVDQNLILLDDATVYNAAHLGGMFSVFNQDAVKDVKLYKGGIPAEYGGRLSSMLDVRMKDGNSRNFSMTGGIGLISSRLTVESPILKDKSSFLLSGRRTYVDLFFPLSKEEAVRKSIAYFYDLNSKINYRINDNNRVFISGYFGRDIMKFGKDFQMQYGNQTFTGRYNHLFSEKLFSNFTLIYSKFDYGLGTPEGVMAFNWVSEITDFSAKNDYIWFITPENTVKFGAQTIHHTFNPGNIKPLSDESIFNSLTLPKSYAYEYAAFISHETEIGERLSFEYGIRFSAFQNAGGTFYEYNESNPNEYVVTDTLVYAKNKIFNTYHGWEPRLGIRLKLSDNNSLKASYHQTLQYIHLATNTMSPTPLDIWFPSSQNIKPQRSEQYALGFFQNLSNHKYEISIEGYYKNMYNSIDFKDHASILGNPKLEGEIRTGSAYSYGVEFQAKKEIGDFSGWISYTWSRVWKKIPEINDGKKYPASHDKPHDISIVLSYDITKRINISSNWVYSTGAPRTMPTGRFEYGGMIAPVYSDRNGVRLPDYHRMDISLTYDFKDKKRNGSNRKFNHSLNVSVYNLYNRHNANSINFVQDETNPNITYAEKMYLFKIFPSITYNFHF